MKIQAAMKIVVWAIIGLVGGIVFELVWHSFEPSLAFYFWPVLGAVIFGQHAYHSHRDKDRPKPPANSDTL
jgi:fatty acid desaturase